MAPTLIACILISTGWFEQQIPPPAVEHMPPEITPYRSAAREDVLTADPHHYRVDFENDETRVLVVRFSPHESGRLHNANEGLFICLNDDCHLRLAYTRSRNQDIQLKHGQTRWVGGGVRTETNLNDTPLNLLFIESKVHGDKISKE